MPCILKVRIDSARNLPVMDKKSDMTDAFVELRFADFDVKRTQIFRKSLNPQWKEDFRFEVTEDSDLQNEPLELRILDYDQITYNEAIGNVFIDLNPLLNVDSGAQISGWFPIYDTLLGIRGELLAHVKLQFFGNHNPFKDSSAGVQFFSTPEIPEGFKLASVIDFVSALDNEDDPEFHWTDSFRAPRKSNENRTRVLFQLSGQVRRVLGRRVLDLHGNAVIGYKQYIDFEEGQKTITVRAIGTAVVLVKDNVALPPFISSSNMPFLQQSATNTSSPLKDSNELNGDDEKLGSSPNINMGTLKGVKKRSAKSAPVLLTLTRLPPNSIISTGGFVSVAAIKVLDNDETTIRENWWTEARDEIKNHAKTLSCTHIIGYTERTHIIDDVIIMYCSGVAVRLRTSSLHYVNSYKMFSSENLDLKPGSNDNEMILNHLEGYPSAQAFEESQTKKKRDCQSCHISYPENKSPFPMALVKCDCCGRKYVPEILLSTAQPPPELQLIGEHVMIEAHVCRPKKFKVGDSTANVISDATPFILYDIHRQLTYKLRIYGLNAIFGLKIEISAGEGLMSAVAIGTAVYVRALPTPPALKLHRNIEVLDEEDKNLYETQKILMEKSQINRANINQALEIEKEKDGEIAMVGEIDDIGNSTDSSVSEIDLDVNGQSRLEKRAMVIEIDDEQDEDLVLFLDDSWTDNISISNIGLEKDNAVFNGLMDSQMITMMKQNEIDPTHHPNRQLAKVFRSMYQEMVMHMGHFRPLAVTGLRYSIALPKGNIVQIFMTALIHGNIIDDNLDLTVEDSFFENSQSEAAPFMARSGSGLGLTGIPILQNALNNFSLGRKENENGSRKDLSGIHLSVLPKFKELGSEEDITSTQPDDYDNLQSRLSLGTIGTDGLPVSEESLEHYSVNLSPLSYIPTAQKTEFIGRISLHFIKEANIGYDIDHGNSGIGGFAHIFMMEVLANVKAHVLCLRGNAVVNYSADFVEISEAIKNQGYAIITVSGDVVFASY